ncbi:Hypothetical predicted protein [Pelobates cultripes]|uniref:Uncharacterized protein n=1 Tax=Pelobates cultripes TaxID=61616 RepID=A0AAD1VXV7_PELCU|nr:Hypothetical predicted protein [Pelobates cultripes]
MVGKTHLSMVPIWAQLQSLKAEDSRYAGDPVGIRRRTLGIVLRQFGFPARRRKGYGRQALHVSLQCFPRRRPHLEGPLTPPILRPPPQMRAPERSDRRRERSLNPVRPAGVTLQQRLRGRSHIVLMHAANHMVDGWRSCDFEWLHVGLLLAQKRKIGEESFTHKGLPVALCFITHTAGKLYCVSIGYAYHFRSYSPNVPTSLKTGKAVPIK